MYRVERRYKPRIESHGVGLDEREGVVPLGCDVNTYDIEANSAVPDACTPGTTEKIEKSEFS